LLVPADEVRCNLLAAAKGRLPLVLYNPAGRKRRELLTEALHICTEQRGSQTLCAFVRNARRLQEEKWIGHLADFPADKVDMSTVIIIGGPRTQWVNNALYEPRGYQEKYME
ncbi:MAG: precorrin-4 C(11)-methyltransferase, partial [Bilophila sp.]